MRGDARKKLTAQAAAEVDPVDVFRKLVREVDAGRALIAMTPPGDQHRAAVDALALARDVLDDAATTLAGYALAGTALVHPLGRP